MGALIALLIVGSPRATFNRGAGVLLGGVGIAYG